MSSFCLRLLQGSFELHSDDLLRTTSHILECFIAGKHFDREDINTEHWNLNIVYFLGNVDRNSLDALGQNCIDIQGLCTARYNLHLVVNG